ncbi:MAG: ABC transporter permease, partial [Myxococcota bacterium]
MIDLRFMMKEAREEFVAGLKEPMVPLLALGLVGYLAIVLMNADYMRDMGATNIYRNAPHVVFLMTAGQGFWLFFAWAWLFSRVVSRDRDALLNEIVLSTPTSLKQLMVARYVGAALLASLLGLVSPLGFLIVHPLDAIGALPAGSVGPTPWGAMAWAWIVLALPSAFGMGALYVSAAFRTRSSAGPFAVAGAAIAIWMVAMVVVRSGSMDSVFSTVLDPTAYAEAEDQSHAWTPKEK